MKEETKEKLRVFFSAHPYLTRIFLWLYLVGFTIYIVVGWIWYFFTWIYDSVRGFFQKSDESESPVRNRPRKLLLIHNSATGRTLRVLTRSRDEEEV